MTTKRNLTLRAGAMLLALLLPVLSVPFAAGAAGYADATAANTAAPIAAVIAENADDLSVVEAGGVYYLFLPGGSDLSAVTVRYTGKTSLYLPDTNTYLQPRDTAVCDFSDGQVTVYEYDEAADAYDSYPLTVLCGASIPSLHFSLDQTDHPGFATVLDWINSDKENQTTASLVMLDGQGKPYYKGDVDTFKGRGNTSFVAPGLAGNDKKSYNFKLAKKDELIPGAGKMKKWSLLHMRISTAYYYDWTGLCSSLGLQTYAALMGKDYFSNLTQYVDVYIGGVYRGVYILTERLDNKAAVDITDQEDFVTSASSDMTVISDPTDPAIIAGVQYYRYTTDALKTTDFDLSGGYLMETNFGSLEDCGFVTAKGMYLNLKAPEVCTREQVQYIAKYVQEFENAICSPTGYNSLGKHYSEYADLESLAGMILTYAFYQNWELFRTSTYVYIDTADSGHPKLTFGPVWDFETGPQILSGDATLFGEHNVYTDTQQYIWLEPLWQKGDFMKIAYEKARKLSGILDATLERTEAADGVRPASKLLDEAHDSLVMNWIRWDIEKAILSNPSYSSHANDFDYYADNFVEALNARKDNWDTLWEADRYLYGVKLSAMREKDSCRYALYCAVTGSEPIDYRWYRADKDGSSGLQIDGQAGARLIVNEPGTYYCVVTGANNAYSRNAQGEAFKSETIDIASPLFSTEDAEEVDKLPEHVPGEWETVQEPTCTENGQRVRRCTICEDHEILENEIIDPTGHDEGKWTILRQPSKTVEGLRVLRCTVCNTELDRQTIPKLFSNNFEDVKTGSWYEDAVDYAVANGLMNGVDEKRFSPDGTMTRGMLVTVLWRMENAPTVSESNPFGDVAAGKYYTDAVLWAASNDIVNGISAGKFSPAGDITREQLAAILYRYAGKSNRNTDARADLTEFPDGTAASEYAKEALSWAYAEKLITGSKAGEQTLLNSKGSASRAQVAAILMRYLSAEK